LEKKLGDGEPGAGVDALGGVGGRSLGGTWDVVAYVALQILIA